MIDIKLSVGLSGYDVIAEFIKQFWERNGNCVDTVIFSIGTSYDGHSYAIHNEIASPVNGDDVEFLYDWWEGEQYLRLGEIRSIDSFDLDTAPKGCEFCSARIAGYGRDEDSGREYHVSPCGNGDLGVRAKLITGGIVLLKDRHIASGYFDVNYCPICGRKLEGAKEHVWDK